VKPSLDLLRSLSDEHVLRALMQHRRLTSAGLAAETGLSKPTAGESVRRLAAAGLVADTGERTPGGRGRGRVGSYYALAQDIGTALAVSIAPGEVVAERIDVYGDTVLDVDVKPNRGDALSILGLAREVSAATGAPIRWQEPQVRETPGATTAERLVVEVDDREGCPRFVGRWVDGVTIGPSPDRVQMRLLAAGLRPISNVVDASNYVMLELGQPTHPYDAELLPSKDLGVRRARAGDRLLTLQQAEGDEPLLLPEGVPLIVSNDVPVAVSSEKATLVPPSNVTIWPIVLVAGRTFRPFTSAGESSFFLLWKLPGSWMKAKQYFTSFISLAA